MAFIECVMQRLQLACTSELMHALIKLAHQAGPATRCSSWLAGSSSAAARLWRAEPSACSKGGRGGGNAAE